VRKLPTLTATALCGSAFFFGGNAANAGPSFDCNDAVKPDEVTICASSELSAGDILTSTAFYQARPIDRKGALAITRSFLERRADCGFNAACIAAEQRHVLGIYSAIGATVLDTAGQVNDVGTYSDPGPVYQPAPAYGAPATDIYFRNCSAARAAGYSRIRVGEPGYSGRLDRDGDGIACE
jgi:hypothetical protein